MGKILIDIKKSERGLVGKTEDGEEVSLSLPVAEVGFLGNLPEGIKMGTPEFDEWQRETVKTRILDNPPYPEYIRLGNGSYVLGRDNTVIIPYDIYNRG